MNTSILIIGAGPAGLAVAGRLSEKNLDYTIIDAATAVANSWRNHYDRLHLHTVKQWSHLPHRPFPEDYPLYVPREKLVAYFEDYVDYYGINVQLQTKVISIIKEGSSWRVKTTKEDILTDHVVFCTGVNNIVYQPTWAGQESYTGELSHSRTYKNADPYKGKKVLVIGMGNTGAELALDLAENDIDVDISVRGEINAVPRDLNGRPVQVTSKQLAKLPFGLGDWLGTQIRKLYFGDLSKYGLKVSKMHPAEQLRTTGKTPIVDIGTIRAIKDGKIKVRPDIQHFEPVGVSFVDGHSQAYDAIICATGYRSGLEAFNNRIVELLDKNGLPIKSIATDEWKGLYFVGFDNYKLGGILGTINTDSEQVVLHISKEIG